MDASVSKVVSYVLEFHMAKSSHFSHVLLQSEKMGYDSRHLQSNNSNGPLLQMTLCSTCRKLRSS